MTRILVFLLFIVTAFSAVAQVPGRREKLPPGVSLPRYDDHFYRKKILYRIDLKEKINKDLKIKESGLYLPSEGRDGKILNNKGIVMALLSSFEKGEVIGYNPDTLNKEVLFANFKRKLLKKAGALPDETSGPAEPGEEEMEDGGGDDEGFDEGDDWGDGGSSGSSAGSASSSAGATDSTGDTMKDEPLDYEGAVTAYMEEMMEIVEDRIFDKNKSDMYYDTQYIILKFINPEIEAQNESLVALKYEDVMAVMNQTQWKNKHNDAEYRTMQEIIENRNFNSFFINLSGLDMQSLRESEKRRQQIIEFEHHLWEF